MRYILIFLAFLLISPPSTYAQQRGLQYYITNAHATNPSLKENENLQKINLLQSQITTLAFKKPQVSLTADYLFAPFFGNNGKLFSITSNPEHKSFGYDASLTNGGLYAAQINASLPLLVAKPLQINQKQTLVQNRILNFSHLQFMHELDKNIVDQYISAYQIQQQERYENELITLLLDRVKVAEALVSKGLMPQSDLLLMEIELKQHQFNAHQARISLSSAFSQLNNSCGLSDTTLYALQKPDITQSLPVTKFSFESRFELDSTNIQAQQDVYNSRYLPQLSAYGNSGINASEAANIPHNAGLSAGLHFVLPLYDGGQKKTVAQQNKILLDNLRFYQSQNRTTLYNNLAFLQQQIMFTQQSLELIDSRLSSQETLMLILKDKVVRGQISVTDYLKAFQDFATSQQDKISTQTNLWLLINQYNYFNW